MSNQIEEIQKLYAKTKTYEIPKEKIKGKDQISIEITPLTLDEIGLLSITNDTPPAKAAEITKSMIAKSLGLEDADVGKIAIEFAEDILAAIGDANNFKDEDMKKTGIKDFLEKKKEQIKKNQEETNGKPSGSTQE